MEREKIIEIFERDDNEYLMFDRIPKEDKFSNSKDLCAFQFIYHFLKQEEKEKDIILSAEHDEIFLCSLDDLSTEWMNENDVVYLKRCGVRYNTNLDCLCMFV
jgi:hypothetical protein